jgi:hypothetical protein
MVVVLQFKRRGFVSNPFGPTFVYGYRNIPLEASIALVLLNLDVAACHKIFFCVVLWSGRSSVFYCFEIYFPRF